MANIKTAYSSNNAITITLTSLANNSAQGSTAIDNTSNLYLDALVQLIIKTGASGTASTGTLTVYAYGSSNGGTNYTDGISGTNGVVTVGSQTNLRPIGTIAVGANATQYTSSPFSVANAFGGVLPDHWGIVVLNSTGGTLDGTIGSAYYEGVYSTVA